MKSRSSAMVEEKDKINQDQDIENEKNKDMGPGIYVNGQGRIPYSQYHFGNKGKIGPNGCSAIAIYNGNIELGNYEALGQIANWIRDNRYTLCSGRLGARPKSIESYFQAKGYRVEKIFHPDQNLLTKKIKNHQGPSILLYLYPFGAHYIMLSFEEKTNTFLIYNFFSNSTQAYESKNLDILFQDKRFLFYAFFISA